MMGIGESRTITLEKLNNVDDFEVEHGRTTKRET